MHLRSFPRRQPEGTIWEIFQMQEVEAKLGELKNLLECPPEISWKLSISK